MDQEPRDSANNNSPKGLLEELDAEGIERPPIWKMVLPWLFSLAIVLFILGRIDLAELSEAILKADHFILIPSMLGFAAVYAVMDAVSYGLSYRWYAAPDIERREMIDARWGAFLFHVLYTPLSTVASLLYLKRKKGTPLLWALSANAFVSVHDIFSINVMVTAALVINWFFPVVEELDPRWLYIAAVPWLVALGYAVYWFTPVRDMAILEKVTTNPILRSCRYAKGRHYLVVLAARLVVAVAGIAAHWLALKAFGIDVPFAMVMVVAPLLIGGAIVPISGGGYGVPQVVALVLLPYADNNEALIGAYSLSFSTLFSMGRALVGAIFLPSYLRDVKERAPLIERDPLSGEPVK